MPLGKSREEQELTRLLAATLVQKEVMEPMEKIGWGHSTPPSPDYSTTVKPEVAPAAAVAPAPVAPAATTAVGPDGLPLPVVPAATSVPTTPQELIAAFESLRDASGMILGKYKTVPEALKGAGHVVTMAKEGFTQRDAALKQIEELRTDNLRLRTSSVAAPATVTGPRTTSITPSRASVDVAQDKLAKVLAGIEENGNILDTDSLKSLAEANRDIAEATAKFSVEEALANRENATNTEREKWLAVDDFMRKNHPESMAFSDEIGLHLASDPLLSQAIGALCAQGKETEATVLAWQSYKRASETGAFAVTKAAAETTEIDLAAKEQARKEALDKARVDAGVVIGSAGGAGIHVNETAGEASQAEIDATRNRMRIEGDAPGSPAAQRFRHLIIGRYLDPSIFPRG